ncbi:MAG: hypothetical protein L7S55_03135, partial [Luminiphilus sp.]|nr:hypothetical protein [Luminiphilus sp.]
GYANSGIGFIFVLVAEPGEALQLAITQAVTLEPGATYEIRVEVATLEPGGVCLLLASFCSPLTF